MDLMGILVYALIAFGVIFVASAFLVIVFLLFEDFWRKLFKMQPAQHDDKSKKGK